jgi:hypothetical protein|mmetsp:Transcript_938/g.2007  ORF Transcript_938/g.2007 Transcript_938/m.2007 type:complete len:126 (-) Transcript_938:104-481(-)
MAAKDPHPSESNDLKGATHDLLQAQLGRKAKTAQHPRPTPASSVKRWWMQKQENEVCLSRDVFVAQDVRMLKMSSAWHYWANKGPVTWQCGMDTAYRWKTSISEGEMVRVKLRGTSVLFQGGQWR